MTTLFTTAYAGSGKIDAELAAHHLDGLLPENLGMVYIPEGEIPRRKQPGLTTVVEWLTKEVGTEGTIPVPDLVATLVKRRDVDGDDVALVTVHDPDNDADVALAKDAHAHGIRVIDLTKAANDMLFDDEPDGTEPEGQDDGPPWAEDEPPVEADAPEATPAASAPSPAEYVNRAYDAGVAAAKAARPASPRAELGLSFNISIPPEGIKLLAQLIVEQMSGQAEASVGQAGLAVVQGGDGVAPVIPIGTTGIRDSGDVAGQPPGTSVYYYNAEAATYRPARGKARAGETRVFLTPAEVTTAKQKGMMG